MRIAQLLGISILLKYIQSACSEGCIRCYNSTCTACDFLAGYQIANNTCAQHNSTVECSVYSMTGGCLVCRENYYLDQSTRTCLTISAGNLIQNCLVYDNLLKCIGCKQDFYFDGSICKIVPSRISNCLMYGANGTTCLSCSVGYAASADSFTCQPISNFPTNCLVSNKLKCLECSQGYTFNPNQYLDAILNQNSITSFFYSLANPNLFSSASLRVFDFGTCQVGPVKNCVSYKNDTQCSLCPKNYYLSTKMNACYPIPSPSIPNCQVYKSINECQLCAQMFYLAGKKNCTGVVPISNCKTYDGTAGFSVCTECNTDFYLQMNSCLQRVSSYQAANCANFSLTEDKCASCSSGFSLNSDYTKCLKSVANCKDYLYSSSDATVLVCSQCADTYYLNTNKECVLGTISNCQTYSRDSNNCIFCVNGFYLQGNICKQHPAIQDCSVYSQSSSGVCDTCKPNTILVAQFKNCLVVTPITNCKTYSTNTTCSACMEGFYLSNNLCQEIPAAENCLIKSTNCLKCKQNYLLINGACLLTPSFQQMNCNSTSNTGVQSEFTCTGCSQNYFLLNYNGLYSCMSSDETGKPRIPNCVRHAYSASNFYCTMCMPNFFLSSDKMSCQATCSGTTVLYSFQVDDLSGGKSISDFTFNQCQPLSNNCLYQVPHANTPGAFACAKCNPNTLQQKQIDGSSNGLFAANHTVSNYDFGLYGETFISNCLSYSNANTFYPGGATPDPNCDSWYQKSTSFLCNACAWSKTGAVSTITISSVQYTYVTCSTTVPDCATTVKYGGLSVSSSNYLAKGIDPASLLSCHKCSGTKIPIVFYDESVSNGNWFKPFGLAQATGSPTSAAVLNGNVVQCLDINKSTLVISDDKFMVPFVDNCALAGLDISQEKSYSVQSQTLFCLACQPGYRRVYNFNQANPRIIKCVPISNCETNGSLFNVCSLCKAGFSWAFLYDQLVPSMEFCVPIRDDPNCLYISDGDITVLPGYSNHKSRYCFACKKGFVFNPDGFCVAYTSPKCSDIPYNSLSSMQLMKRVFSVSTGKFEYPLSLVFTLLSNSFGCTRCDDGFYAVKQTSNKFGCVLNDKGAFTAPSFKSKFILNCINLRIENGIQTCSVCLSGFILAADRLSCLPATAFPNCAVVQNGDCVQCNNQYILNNGLCKQGKIENCLTYDLKGICLSCNAGYRLLNGFCQQGTQVGCVSYDTNGNCAACDSAYILVKVKNNINYCLADPFKGQCAQYDSTLSTNFLTCNTCSTGFGLNNDVSMMIPTLCLQPNSINLCKTYDIQSTLMLSSLGCKECISDNGYMKNGDCVARQTKISNCVAYSSTSPACVSCASGYFVDQNGLVCTQNPQGIPYCDAYVTNTQCSDCMAPYYLSNNICLSVTTQVPNCKYYSSATQCKICAPNYLLDSANTCVRTFAVNCMTYTDIKTCQTCSDLYGLQLDNLNNITHCVPIAILNCARATNIAPFSCVECIENFYPSDGGCLPVVTKIDSCLIYQSNTTCSKCSSPKILTTSMKACVDASTLKVDLIQNCNSLYGAGQRNLLDVQTWLLHRQ